MKKKLDLFKFESKKAQYTHQTNISHRPQFQLVFQILANSACFCNLWCTISEKHKNIYAYFHVADTTALGFFAMGLFAMGQFVGTTKRKNY